MLFRNNLILNDLNHNKIYLLDLNELKVRNCKAYINFLFRIIQIHIYPYVYCFFPVGLTPSLPMGGPSVRYASHMMDYTFMQVKTARARLYPIRVVVNSFIVIGVLMLDLVTVGDTSTLHLIFLFFQNYFHLIISI